jgi:uncharacterized 2Fe-2S/4Fe-4S cluster protein (DUF4445 family)
MAEHKVTFYPVNKQVKIKDGENLLRAAMIAEVHINASCGGDGTCGKCKVIVDSGKVDVKSTGKLTQEEIEKGYILACLALVKSDLEVRIPIESRLGDRKVLERERCRPTTGHTLAAHDTEILMSGLKLNPAAIKIFLKLPQPTIDDNLSDLERLTRELSRQHNIKNLTVDVSILRNLAFILRDAEWEVTLTLFDSENGLEIINIEAGDTSTRNFGIAVDIGTTTVVVQLLDLNEGKVLAKGSNYNGQISCGEDVISRIIFAQKEDGLTKLHNLVISTVNSLITEVASKANIKLNEITTIVAAGNTTMSHLLLGLNPKFIREAPYIPTIKSLQLVKAKEVGIDLNKNVYLTVLPSVASYVGGDITSGILGSGFFQTEKLSLFIDIGTNGEMVLGNSEWLVTCSCSAGPAFEGGGIKHGMRASKGAIEQVRISCETCEPMLLTIGQVKPKGICGSGLIDAAAELFLNGIIDQKGKFNLDLNTLRVRANEGGAEYVLAFKDETQIDADIVLTEVDLDNLIRAKGAIYAGITILVESVGVKISDIEQIIIAGAFGNYIEIEKAVIIGLFPELEADKFNFIGNGSLMGARAVAFSKDLRKTVSQIADKMAYLELSVNPDFMDRYVSALFLPHTNLDSFPGVMKMLESRT